jgi:hypothetical protein
MVYPNGRAYAWKEQEGLQEVIADVMGEVYVDVTGLLDHVLPDNDVFNEEDASIAEDWLGIVRGVGVSLADRKLAIRQKLNYPGDEVYRQHRLFVETQLRLAGFAVKVYENRFDTGGGVYISKSPGEILSGVIGAAVLGEIELGEAELGATWASDGVTIVANSLEEAKDDEWSFGGYYGNTFIVAGEAGITDFASVPAARKNEFRILIHSLKQVQAVGFLFVHYV